MKLDNCYECPFGSRTCGSRGPIESRIVIVGESPGDNELRVGRPFVGQSGELLEKVLRECGFEEPYITNAFKCGPPGGDRKTDEAVNNACRACNSRLINELSAHPRKLIITMGNAATRAVLGRYNIAITSVRGSMQESNLASIGVLPTFHPVHILHNEGIYPQFLADMKKAAQFMRDGVPTNPTTSYKVMDSREVWDEAIEKLHGKTVASDIESTGLSFKKDEFHCIGMSPVDDLSTTYILKRPLDETTSVILSKHTYIQKFNRLVKLCGPNTKWVWHNGKFDCRFMRGKGTLRQFTKVHHDTMLLSYALDENGGRHGLEQCVMDWLGVPKYKDMLSQYLALGNEINKKLRKLKLKEEPTVDIIHSILFELGFKLTDDMIKQWMRTGYSNKSYALVPEDLRHDYLAHDIYYTGSLFNKLYPLVKKDENLSRLYHELLIPASNALATVEINGLPLDQKQLGIAIRAVKSEIDPLVEDLRGIVDDKSYNPNSGKQTGSKLIELGFKIIAKTKAGIPATGEDILKQYQKIQGELDTKKFISTLLEYRKWQKVQSTYLKPYLKYGSRIHPTFSIHGTVTGRLSSSSPNLQNLPKYGKTAELVRSAIRCKLGRVLISLDYSQAELRSLAVLSGDPDLIQIFMDGADMHSEVAKKVFGPNYTKAQRTGAKRVNFGVIYGAGPAKLQEQILADGVNVTLDDARSYIEMWSEAYPIAWKFIQETRDITYMEKRLVTVFGRKRRFHVFSKSNWHGLENKAGNFLHQSMCSDFTLESCIRQDKLLGDLPGNPLQVNIVHDDNLMEVDDNPEAICKLVTLVKTIMEQVPIDMGIDTLPFIADAEIGKDWGTFKSLDMDAIKQGKVTYEK